MITAVLLAAMVLLLLGIFSRLPAPDLTPAEPGATAIDYSTFLAQVRAANVLVVNLQGQEVVGSLARPLTGGRATVASRTRMTQQQALAATNRADILDPALLRPGRFDRHISVSLPDRAGRLAILRVHTRHTPLHEEVSLERLARLTPGMSGADLANLVNEAALRAARCNLERVTSACFDEALARILLGALRPIVVREMERRDVAYHEAGHALVAHYLPEADRVSHVTILPRGKTLGVTQFVAEEDRYNYSREQLMARLAVGLGGRAAEELAFGPERVTTGAENDFQAVTGLARKMVARWGMSERVGAMFVEGRVSAGNPALNFRHDDALAACVRTLAAGPDGRLLLNGGEVPARQHRYVTPKEELLLFYAAANTFLHALPVRYLYSYAHNRPSMEGEAKTGVACLHERSKRKRKERVQMANLIDTLHEEGIFSTFIRAIKMTEIVATLQEPGACTMFAPTDAAFAQMKAKQVVDLFEDYYNMSKLVKYHIVMGIYRTTDLLDRIFLKTLEDQRLVIASSATGERETETLEDGTDAHGYVVRDTVTSTLLESIKVNGAHITRGNVSADNGLIHVIDKVLVPRFMIL